jgi:pilus assembly protein CpaE
MKPHPDLHDAFDAGFEAEDEFAPASAPGDDWAEQAAAQLDPFAMPAPPVAQPIPLGEPAPAAHHPPAGNPVGEMQSHAASAMAQVSVPRITIHVFCERPQTAAVVDRASRDRRMSRATALVQPGGLAAAVAYYQNQPTPSRVVVECSDRGQGLLGLLDQLAEVCDPGTKVIVIGAANDIALYRELIKRGVSEYLVPPLQPMQIISSITSLYSDPSAPFVGRQIAVVGAKGGVGASTIAHNLAYALSERTQTNTVLADFDLAFGTAGLDFNQDPLQGMANALNQPDRLDPVLLERMMAHCTEKLSLFAAPATLDDDYDIGADAYEEVVGKIRSTAPLVVLDLPHLWSNWMRRVLLASDEVVIVCTPDLAGLRNAKNMFDLLKQGRPNDAPPKLVLNQVGVPGRPEIPVKDFGEAMGTPPVLALPFDPKVFGKAANNGQMIFEVGAKSKAAEGLEHLAQLISRREAQAAPARQSRLSSLFKRK